VRIALTVVVVATLATAACTGPDAAPRPTPSSSQARSPDAAEGPRPVAHPTLWLCRPGLPDNPCEGGLDATVVRADGSRSLEPFVAAVDPVADCFYVYPTVSESKTLSAPLEVTQAEVRVVRIQAARFAASCRLFAPAYQQITRQAIFSGGLRSEEARDLAYSDVLSAFNDYLNTFNQGRPFVLIGHSQGTTNLVRLIQEQIDGDGVLRGRLLSALLLGGSVTVLPGEDAGGTFVNIPACRSSTQTGCVVAYDSYAGEPPADGLFGRSTPTRQSLCVQPGALLGQGDRLRPYYPTTALVGEPPRTSPPPTTGFTAYPDAVTAGCRTTPTFGWLDVAIASASPGAPPPIPSELGPTWGLHRVDITLALGDLVALVAAQASAASG
jgi:hypothetical protein